MIKYAKSLGRINEEKYDGCFIGRVEKYKLNFLIQFMQIKIFI